MSGKDRIIPYFNLYASDFLAYRSKLSSEQLVDVLQAICDLCLFGESDFSSDNSFQMRFYDKVKNDLLRNAKKYTASVENGKKGGRPRKQTDNNPDETQKKPIGFVSVNLDETQTKPIQYNTIQYNIKEENIKDNIKKIDTLSDPIVEKCFNLYSEICINLLPLKFEKRSKAVRDLLSEYLYETNNDLEYFKELCIKANKLKQICDIRLDFKSMIKNHISINNGKFLKGDKNIGTMLKFK